MIQASITGAARAQDAQVDGQGDSAAPSTTPPSTAPPPSPGAIPASRLATNLAIITIKGEIDAVTSTSFERRLNRAVDGGADAIVIEIDSPGGAVGAVLEITALIKRCPIRNITAWVNPNAYSGGAIIALACPRIVISPGATMGDAAPIMASPLTGLMELPDTERMKLLSPLIAEVVDSARRNGYDEQLVQAFVSLGVELWFIRDKNTGERYFVTEDEYRAIFGQSPPRGTPHIASGGTIARSGPVGAPTGVATMSDEQIAKIEDQIDEPSTRPRFDEMTADRYELIHYATDGKTLLTLKEQDLKDYGFADPHVTPRTESDVQTYHGATTVRTLSATWSEKLVRFMTQGMSGMVVRGLLVIIFLLAMFIEMTIPGVGIPGGVALLALAGLVVPPMLIGAASWWTGVAIVSGIVLIAFEVFVAPGFGVPGILGLLALFGGLVGTFAQSGELFPGTSTGDATDLAWAVSIVLMGVIVAGVGMYFFTKMTNRFPVMGKLVLADVSPSDVSPSDVSASTGLLGAMGESTPAGPVAVGAIGRTRTPLRPSGQAEFGEVLVDVVAEYGFIDEGQPVRAVSVTIYRVGVEPAPDDAGSVSGASNGGTNT